MPTYVYECRQEGCPAFGQHVEFVMTLAEHEKNAPTCSGSHPETPMVQVIFPAAIKFKGQGWTPRFGR